MTTEERLANLERELTAAKRTNRLLLTIVSLAALGLILAGTWSRPTALGQNQVSSTAPKSIRAREFIVEDEKGEACGTLQACENGLALVVSNTNKFGKFGKRSLKLQADHVGRALTLCDANDSARAEFALFDGRVVETEMRLHGAHDGHAEVLLHADDNMSNMVFCGGNGKARIRLAGFNDGPEISVCDASGKTRVGLRADNQYGPLLQLLDEKEAGRVLLRVDNKFGPLLNLFDEKAASRVALAILEEGATLRLYDANGKGRATLGATTLISPDGTETKHPESSLALFGPDGKVLRSMP